MTSESTTKDTLLGGRVTLHQPAMGYRVAIDPVLLAAAVPAKPGQMVLDVGAGVGAAALCLAARVGDLRIAGIELDRIMAGLARKNVADNHMAGRIDMMTGNLLRPPARLAAGSFDHVITNPPHGAQGAGTPPPGAAKAAAHVEATADLAAWLDFCLLMARGKGRVTLIHRAGRLAEILGLLHGRLGDIAVMPLWPKAGDAAKRVVISGRKGIKGSLTLHPGLVLHAADGSFTPAAEHILRDGAAMPFADDGH